MRECKDEEGVHDTVGFLLDCHGWEKIGTR